MLLKMGPLHAQRARLVHYLTNISWDAVGPVQGFAHTVIAVSNYNGILQNKHTHTMQQCVSIKE